MEGVLGLTGGAGEALTVTGLLLDPWDRFLVVGSLVMGGEGSRLDCCWRSPSRGLCTSEARYWHTDTAAAWRERKGGERGESRKRKRQRGGGGRGKIKEFWKKAYHTYLQLVPGEHGFDG